MKKFLTALLALVMLLAIATVSLADGVGFSAYENQGGEVEEDYAYTGKVDVGKVDANGHCGAGETMFILPDGSTATGNGVTLSGGAKYETVEVSGQLRAGTEDYNMHAGGSAALMTAGVSGGANAGVSSDGKLQVSAHAGCEANVAEASGKVGSTIGGVEVNVSGSVKVGIGAKASVGYSNGKLKCEVGAALGVGGSFGFEVDVGALATKTGNALKSAWDWLTDW